MARVKTAIITRKKHKKIFRHPTKKQIIKATQYISKFDKLLNIKALFD